MKILLLGEYSRLHNSLKEGLMKNGHEVFLAGYGDYFKDFPLDLKFRNKYHSGFWLILKKIVYRLLNIDLQSRYTTKFFFKNQDKLKGYDIVQLINENTFKTLPRTEIKLLDFILKNNKKVFLLSCGSDYLSIKYAYEKKLRYSILTPYFEKKISTKKAFSLLNYISEDHEKLHRFIFENINGVIASDLDYHIPLLGNKKYMGMIPNPINIDIHEFQENPIVERIVIFHGINSENYFKKGHDIFEKALNIVEQKHHSVVEIITVNSLPYNDYINSYRRAHIILDQIYSYDQGYNALEAMAKGKVVFTGAEKEWRDHYKVQEDTIAINALPEVEVIVKKIEWLLLNPKQIKLISRNARKFVEEHHNYKTVAENYTKIWSF